MEKIQNKDFIELEYTGRIKNGEIFDTNISEDAKKLNSKLEVKPIIICIGQNMILPAIDSFLVEKELGTYTLELTPEKAFGIRQKDMIKVMPVSIFFKHQIRPVVGETFYFDNMTGKVAAISGGRVIVDFNHPLSGKDVVYELKILRKIESIEEKAKSLVNYLFRQDIPCKVEGKKLILETDEKMSQFLKIFNDKFKEMLDLDLDFKIVEKEHNHSEHNH